MSPSTFFRNYSWRLRSAILQFSSSWKPIDSPAIEKRLLASEFEIALITNPSHRAEIVYEPYEEMELVAFCLPTNPLARKKLTLKELAECPLVLRGGGRLEKVLMNLGYKMNVALRCEASTSVKAAVRHGHGSGNSLSKCCRQPGCQRQSKVDQRSRIEADGGSIVYYL